MWQRRGIPKGARRLAPFGCRRHRDNALKNTQRRCMTRISTIYNALAVLKKAEETYDNFTVFINIA